MRVYKLASLIVVLVFSCGRKDTLQTTPVQTSLISDEEEKTLTLDLGGGVKLELVSIPAGEFMIGSPEDEGARDGDEGPQHRVRFSKPFYMGKYEVTQAQWKAVMGENPSQFKGDDRLPVERVSWNDSVEFCRKVSRKTGKQVRLPSEAEWEYACRAGSTTAYSFGGSRKDLGQYTWYGDNSDEKTHPVGQKKPNRCGLYDMHGNVWEWCADWYGEGYYATSPAANPKGPATGEYRVLRGGAWNYYARYCRSANRIGDRPNVRDYNNGFRVAAGSR
jgi:formylglycine-generating enzyme required for sulfatase activity